MKIKFCGAAREVTGSSHLITLDNGYRILLDCGLYQGSDEDMDNFNREWRFDPASIDCVILSHAHIDHTGRLPKLVKDGYQGVVHATHATRSLCSIMLLDSAHIQERDAEYQNKKNKKKNKKAPVLKPLYDAEDVQLTMKRFVGHGYDRWFEIAHGIEVLFKDAGHILGSASVTIKITEDGKEKVLAFSGDIGRPNRPILRDPVPMPEADIVISESTYGDRIHDESPMETERFLSILKKTCIDQKGKLIIPAFSIGRTQEIVYIIDRLETEGLLPRIPIYVDSPLAVNATEIFGTHPECYDDDLNEYLLVDDNPFGFKGLHYIRKVEESKKLNVKNKPCVIISASGMMNAGRIRHHLFNNLEDERNTLLIVGYCAPNTLGGILRAGATEVKLFGEIKQVKLHIEIMDSFSAHGDQLEMLDFLKNQRARAKELFLVHGEYDSQLAFKEKLLQLGFEKITIPRLGDEYLL